MLLIGWNIVTTTRMPMPMDTVCEGKTSPDLTSL